MGLRHPQKVHAVDAGLRNAVCLTGAPDLGRLAETVVCGALRRDEAALLSSWRGEGEVDLVLRRGSRTEALVQVVYDVEGRPDVLRREIRALEEARVTFPDARLRLVLARPPDRETPSLPEGVELVPLWRLLLTEGA
jgi:predicted AAA+ superfamily ATPase